MQISFSKFIFILIFCFVGPTQARAGIVAKNLYLFGGAGDDSTSENIFSDEFIDFHQKASDADWNTIVLFDGDQPKEQKRVSEAIKKFNLYQFSKENFVKYLGDINPKNFQTDDEVLFIIDTHGGIESTADGHILSCTGDEDCDSGTLKINIKALESKGVKVAVIDLSCYSGQSLKMKSDKTCVISGASTDDVGFGDFDSNLLDQLTKGHSLEQIYLDTRSTNQLGRPRISTPAGLAAEETIKKIAGESVVDLDLDSTNVAPSICKDCNNDKLKKILNLSDEMLQKSAQTLQSAKNYMRATSEYRKLFQRAQKKAEQLQPFNKKFEKVSGDNSNFSWIALAEVKKKDNKEAYEKRLELEKSNPEFRQMEKLLRSYRHATSSEVDGDDDNFHAESKLAQAALNAEKYENQLYLDLYKSYQGNEENPCAKFIF